MSINDELKVDLPPENDENEFVTSLQEHDVRNTTVASNNEISEEIVQNKIFLHEDQADDPRVNEDLKDLYRYAREGWWGPAYWNIFMGDPLKNSKYLTARISDNGDIALHVAVVAESYEFVCNLVQYMMKEDLAIKNGDGNTAFFLAAASGRVYLAEDMFEKNVELPSIHGNREMLPIHVAAYHGHKEMVEFLYKVQGPLEEMDSNKLFQNRTNLFEIFEDVKRLYRLALRNDWYTAYTDIFKRDIENSPISLSASISDRGDIALHVAVAANSSKFVQRLVKYMHKEDLAIKNHDGNTAFYLAALSGRVELAKLMFEKNEELLKIPGNRKMLPIHVAAERGHKKMLEFLYIVSKEHLEDQDLYELLCYVISNTDLYDFALNLLKERPCVLDGWRCHEALCIMAGTPTMSRDFKLSFGSDKLPHEKLPPQALKLLKLLLEKVDSCVRWIDELIDVAVKHKNVELLSIIVCDYPWLILTAEEKSFSLLIECTSWKHEEGILKLINRMNTFFEINVLLFHTRYTENNILHLAAMLPPSYLLDSIPGVALQMQHELWWFKEVRKIVNASVARAKNKKGDTPIDLFNEKHKDLREKGEKWMKDTANSCMIVAALIATVVFASVFTIPSDTKDGFGMPHFVREVSFTVFVISDVVSLVSSICSILTFLSILTSRYAYEDFLFTLPIKLIVGLSTLLLSIVAMMIVFCATIFIVFEDGNIWVPILVSVISSLPAILFTKQQQKALFDVALLTYKISYHSDEEGRARELNKFSDGDNIDDDDDMKKDNRRWKYLEKRYQYCRNKLQRCLKAFYLYCVRR